MFMRVPGVAVLPRGVRYERSMGVAQCGDLPAVVSAGAIWLRLGRASLGMLGEGHASQV